MKFSRSTLTRTVAAVLVFALCGVVPSTAAYAQAPSTQQAPQQTAEPIGGAPQSEPADQAPSTTAPVDQNAQQPGAPQQTAPSGAPVDPSQGPLTPVPTQEAPDAPSATQPAPQPQTQPAGQTPASGQQTQREPLGAAAAEGIRTAGGGASRPAGSAIAPAKQRQVRSFLIKLGAVAAAGVAIGTIYALSRGTSSTPPNAGVGTPAQ